MTMCCRIIIPAVILLILSQSSAASRKNTRIARIIHTNKIPFHSQRRQRWNWNIVRGGSKAAEGLLGENEGDADEERYSRQFYTLGARAHSLVRLSTVVVDGPTGSGLVYEAIKNLALSGVGKIVIITKDKSSVRDDSTCTASFDQEELYFNQEMDDLGITYMRAARAECFPNDAESEKVDNLDLILEYVRRLNPSVRIHTIEQSDFASFNRSSSSIDNEGEKTEKQKRILETIGSNPVFLCVDRPLSSQLRLNKICRDNSIPFISIETAGVYGRVFCDFGENFYVMDEDGETPKITLLEEIKLNEENDLTKGAQITVHCVEGEHHDVSRGDVIEFQWKNDVEESLRKLQFEVHFVKSPICFTVKISSDTEEEVVVKRIAEAINQSANSFTRIKTPKKISFLPLYDALKKADNQNEEIFAASDLDKSFDVKRRLAIMNSFDALEKFVKNQARLPDPFSDEGEKDCDVFLKLVGTEENPNLKSIINSFALYAKAKFMPLQAIYGALGAQEVLKAASSLYNPIRQFLLFDCDEVLNGVERKDRKNADGKKVNAAGIKYILGGKLIKKLSSQKIFVVGSGAIGCELLKNLASIEAGTRRKHGGCIILTDMDTIERSNLSRQLLFRDSDVGKFKSAAAQEAVQRLNPRVCMDTHTSKVGEDSTGNESYFNDKFWSDEVNIVMNALDNVEARLFMDSQCVANHKAMIDAGTLGSKGNVQVVVPCQSESYGSSIDPPEPTIAVCTLKNFPYEISHTIQWGRDLFDGLFNRRPSQVNEYSGLLSSTSVTKVSKILAKNLGEEAAVLAAREMAEDFQAVNVTDNMKETAIAWAVALSRELFYVAIKDLLLKHPLDGLDEDGEPFWTGTRRAPTPLLYSKDRDISDEEGKINEYLIDFVRYAARLRFENYVQSDTMTISSDITVEEARLALQAKFISKEDALDQSQSAIEFMSHKLTEAKRNADLQNELNIASFEKDDDSNGHVAFVTAASNLRAIAYGISPVDAMETRRIAGRIVPAMITTTALVSALSCIELVKLIQNAPLRSYRNAFVNLALPFFAFTAPLPAEQVSGIHGNVHTIWDRIVVKESEKARDKGGITLRRLIRQIKKKASGELIEVSNVSCGPYMLYANFLHEDDDLVLDKPVFELVAEAILSSDEDFELVGTDDHGQIDIDTEKLSEVQQREVEALRHRSFLDFSVLVEDPETGEEAELPPVRLMFFNRKTT